MDRARMKRFAVKNAKQFKIGDSVNYHSVIGREVTSGPHKLRSEPFKSSAGDWVVFIEGKAGFVDCAAISAAEGEQG